VAAAASAWLATGWVRSQDRNRDGRPDRWCFYDARGELTRVATDTNFDGRSDLQDYYHHGVLIRRERDRNLDDRIDLVESFDPTSHEPIRSVVDVDSNGETDRVVLFRNGQPIFTEWLPAEPTTPTVPVGSLEPGELPAPLVDSSRHHAAIDAIVPDSSSDGTVGVLSVMGLPEARLDWCTAIAVLHTSSARAQARRSLVLSRHSPRGPPPVSLV
jgi:hypothetical protein